MNIVDLLTRKSIDLNATATTKEDCIKQAVQLMDKSGNIDDLSNYEKGVFEREEIASTGVGNFIAIPHCKSTLTALLLGILKKNEKPELSKLNGWKGIPVGRK